MICPYSDNAPDSPLGSWLCCLITLLKLFLYNKIEVLGGKANFVASCDEPKNLNQEPLQVKRNGTHAWILHSHTLVWTSPLYVWCSLVNYIQVIKEIQSRRKDRSEMSLEQTIIEKPCALGSYTAEARGKGSTAQSIHHLQVSPVHIRSIAIFHRRNYSARLQRQIPFRMLPSIGTEKIISLKDLRRTGTGWIQNWEQGPVSAPSPIPFFLVPFPLFQLSIVKHEHISIRISMSCYKDQSLVSAKCKTFFITASVGGSDFFCDLEKQSTVRNYKNSFLMEVLKVLRKV